MDWAGALTAGLDHCRQEPGFFWQLNGILARDWDTADMSSDLRALPGWRPYESWAFSPEGLSDIYLTEDHARLHVGPRDEKGRPVIEGIQRIRDCLRAPHGVVRLVGLSGVGKTRLMGAFITYLYLTGRSRHFFVLAPNTTIYDKLVADFTQNTEKYVFKGIAEFVQMPPIIVTGDTWDQGRGVRGGDLLGETAIVNIFNVDKINKDAGRIKKLHEYIGQSYFDYLAELPDLVLLMDEAHRYRAKAGMKAVSEPLRVQLPAKES